MWFAAFLHHSTFSLTLSTLACSYSSLETQLTCHLFQKTGFGSPTPGGQGPCFKRCSHDPFLLTSPVDLTAVSYQMTADSALFTLAHEAYPRMGLSDMQWGLVNWAGAGGQAVARQALVTVQHGQGQGSVGPSLF